ncbi:diamine N-acetyltransferase [Anaerolineae bacterium]|nr:diamine N-acetyltransferase [Anaerolineae bacterium]
MDENTFPQIIETPRLVLRIPSVSNAPMVNAAVRESFADLHRWMKWAKEIPTVEETINRAQRANTRPLAGEDFSIWGFLKDTDEFVLGSGFHLRDPEVPKFEIGYWCRSSYQGRGFVTEAVRVLTRVGFEQMQANRIEIRCDARNERSRRVAERTGYRLEAELRNDQRAPDGVLRNTLIYAMFPDEFRQSIVYFEKP